MSILDEAEADHQVNLVYSRIGKKIIIKEGVMRLIKGSDGKIYRASSDTEVTREQLNDNVAKAQELVKVTGDLLAEFDQLTLDAEVGSGTPTNDGTTSTSSTAEPAVGETVAPADEVVPAEPEAPVTPEVAPTETAAEEAAEEAVENDTPAPSDATPAVDAPAEPNPPIMVIQ